MLTIKIGQFNDQSEGSKEEIQTDMENVDVCVQFIYTLKNTNNNAHVHSKHKSATKN